MLSRPGDREDGQLMVLVVVYAALAAALVLAAIDVSTALLARRSLAGLADGAALAAAAAADRPALYAGTAPADVLPLSVDSVQAGVGRYLADAGAADDPTLTVLQAAPMPDGAGAVVTLRRQVRLPFLAVLRFAHLGPGWADGTVDVQVTAHARAPLLP